MKKMKSNSQAINNLSKNPIGVTLASAVANRLKNNRNIINAHRDYCGHGLDFKDGKFRLLSVHDGLIEHSDVVHEWDSEKGFIEFLARQSDWSLSGADIDEEILYTDDDFFLNNQRITKATLKETVDFKYDQKFIQFFEHLIRNESEQSRVKSLSALLARDNEVGYAIQEVLSVLNPGIILQIENVEMKEVLSQIEAISRKQGFEDSFIWEKDGKTSFYTRIRAYVDFLDKRGCDAIYWIKNNSLSCLIPSKRESTEKLLQSAKEAGFFLQTILPTDQYPDGFKIIEDIQTNDLKEAIKVAAKEAKAMNKKPFLYIGWDDCVPCVVLENSLKHPALIDVFNDIYILKIDLLRNIVALKSLSHDITAAPTLINITDEGEVTHDLIDGGAWEEDTPENIAAALQPFFERVTSNK